MLLICIYIASFLSGGSKVIRKIIARKEGEPENKANLYHLYRHKKTPAQVLIRWCLDNNFIVFPKSVKEQRIIENADVYDFQLSPEDLKSMV